MRPVAIRIVVYVLTVFAIVSLHFVIIHAMPGDPLIHILGEDAYALLGQSSEQLEKVREQFGLDGSLPVRYVGFWKNILQGKWGHSLCYGQPVFLVIMKKLPQTLLLLTPALFISAILAAVFGTLAGFYNGSRPESLTTKVFMVLYSLPGFCIAMLLVSFMAAFSGNIPRGGLDILAHGSLLEGLWIAIKHMALPVAVVSIGATAAKYLVMKSAIVQILSEDFVLTAVSKGLSGWRLLAGHIFPNALPPLINMVALHAGFLVSGALLVEIVFSWPGMGSLIREAALSRDYPLLMGCFAVLSSCVLLANALADVLCVLADPRVADGSAAQ
jgi:peptide/nickel transport system permease protein